METNKIVSYNDIKNAINLVFNCKILKTDLNEPFFSIDFEYKIYDLRISKSKDRNKGYYINIEIKKKDTFENGYNYTDFYYLLAFYDEERYILNFTNEKTHYYLEKLKYYIDNNKLFFEYHSLDFQKRFFEINNKIIKLSSIIDLKGDLIDKFGDMSSRITNNMPIFM